MNSITRIIFATFTLLTLGACSTMQIGTLYQRAGEQPVNAGRDVFVTIDGTSNTPVARTNAARLFEIVDSHHADRKPGRQLATYYAEGVGSNGNFLGSGAGLGTSDDIKFAYEFLTSNYRYKGADTKDRIFLSGFSRGAYAARAVGGMIAVAGVPDLSAFPRKERRKIVDAIFDAYKTGRKDNETRAEHFSRRAERVREAMHKRGITLQGMENQTQIEAMALWDTVAAIGLPDQKADPREEVSHYLLTNCNVKKVFHVLALDDNRASNFTPVFANARHIYAGCEADSFTDKVEEVWFSGSHSDAAGTYETEIGITDHLHGVSMNWMLSRLDDQDYGLFPKGKRVFEDTLGAVHDARDGLGIYKLWKTQFRFPLAYQEMAYTLKPEDADLADIPFNSARLPDVHESAIERLRKSAGQDRYYADCGGEDAQSQPRRTSKVLCSAVILQNGFAAELKRENCRTQIEPSSTATREKSRKKCINIIPKEPG